jgi:site-specific recombinase XerD
MANLRGGSFEKQVKDAFHRLESFGVARHGSNSHKTHSNALAAKRDGYLRDYREYAERNGIEGKLNQSLTPENMERFLNERLEGLARSTKEDYARGWSSMVQGLREANITIPIDRGYFDVKVSEIKETEALPEVRTGRAVENAEAVIQSLYSHRYESGVIAEVQNSLGLRVSEAVELVRSHELYIQDHNVVGLVGKGNHEYDPKCISPALEAKIALAEYIPSESTYRNDLSEVTNGQHTSHDFRYSYAEREFASKLEAGVSYHDALKQVSQGLNHSREEMTNYYLARA